MTVWDQVLALFSLLIVIPWLILSPTYLPRVELYFQLGELVYNINERLFSLCFLKFIFISFLVWISENFIRWWFCFLLLFNFMFSYLFSIFFLVFILYKWSIAFFPSFICVLLDSFCFSLIQLFLTLSYFIHSDLHHLVVTRSWWY